LNDCEKCLKLKKYEIVLNSSSLASCYKKLISWLVRIPFTRLKSFDSFREEINSEMRNFLKLMRKNFADKFIKDISFRVSDLCINNYEIIFIK
jgi:hypothetical protein